jgi:hypothetical protein
MTPAVNVFNFELTHLTVNPVVIGEVYSLQVRLTVKITTVTLAA